MLINFARNLFLDYGNKKIMALITMLVYDTEENQRHHITSECLKYLANDIDIDDKFIIIDNNSEIPPGIPIQLTLKEFCSDFQLITMPVNFGIPAINMIWKIHGKPDEYRLCIESDVIVHSGIDWIREMETIMRANPDVGMLALKRNNADSVNSKITNLRDEKGNWYPFEEVDHILGQCIMFSPLFLEKTGYIHGPGKYGWEDILLAVRARIAGFRFGYLPYIHIEELFPGATEKVVKYYNEKHTYAQSLRDDFIKLRAEYESLSRPVYYEPDWKEIREI